MPGGRLVVYDDTYPDVGSGFRLAEIGAYLDAFPDAVVAVAAGPDELERRRAAYAAIRPDHLSRVVSMSHAVLDPAPGLLYAIFLNNAHDLVAWSESEAVPFAFQLYPGGGFAFDNPQSDAKLSRVLGSPMFAGVVVTQRAVRDYLAERFHVPDDRVTVVGPGPVWTAETSPMERPYHGAGKATFDVGFVAHKYAGDVRGKGYDFFVEAARRVAAACAEARFHVVGDWTPADHPLGDAADRFEFHGVLTAPELDRLCHALDVVVSPNIPGTLARGGFDGFPLAACSQAALAGAIVLATDPLRLNHALVPGRDFLLLERSVETTREEDVERAAEQLVALARDPSRAADLARRGQRAFADLVGPAAQLAPRVALLRDLMSRERPAPDDASRWKSAARAAARAELQARGELARLDAVIRDARAYIEQKERNVAELAGEVARLNDVIRDARAYVEQKERNVAELAGEVARLNDVIRDARAYVEQKDRDVAELVDVVRRLEQALEAARSGS